MKIQMKDNRSSHWDYNNETQSQDFNISVSDELIAWNINAKESLKYIPGGVFLIILIIIGLTGNSLVFYVYKYHFKSTTANLFIKVLAILDAICCLFGILYEIISMFFPFLSSEPVSCKTFRTVERTAEVISGELMLLIAYDRYLHVCKPFEVFSYSKAKRLVYAAAVAGTVISLPALVIIGMQESDFNGVKLLQCYLDPVVKDSYIVLIYFVSINVLFLCSLFIMVGLYSRIWIVVYKWRHTIIGETTQVFATKTSNAGLHFDREQLSVSSCYATEDISTEASNEPLSGERMSGVSLNISKSKHSVLNDRRLQSLRRRKTLKPLIILFAVAVAFVVSFLPQFVINILSTARVIDMSTMTLLHRQWWEVAYKSYFISNVINPIIYATFDDRFRQKCFQLLIQQGYYDRMCCQY